MSDNNVCIAVDACCDLPPDFLHQNNIRILPIYLKIGDQVLTDNRDPDKTLAFYQAGMLDKSTDAKTSPFTADEMSNILEKELVLKYDKVLAITIMASRSKVYENIRDAVWVSQPKFKDLRGAKGMDRRFQIEVMDSNNIFTGPAVLVYEAARLLKQENASLERITTTLERLSNHVRTLLVPKGLYHLKHRAGNRGEKSDKSINWFSYQLGNMLNIKPIIQGHQGETGPVAKSIGFKSGLDKIFETAMSAIDHGLSVNVVTMSYAGDLSEIQKEAGYQNFVNFAKTRNVPTLLTMMSTTAAINIGPGSFSLSYAD